MGAAGWGRGSPSAGIAEPEAASRPILPREDATSARGDCGTGRAVPGVWAGKEAGVVRLAAGRRAGGWSGGALRTGCRGRGRVAPSSVPAVSSPALSLGAEAQSPHCAPAPARPRRDRAPFTSCTPALVGPGS